MTMKQITLRVSKTTFANLEMRAAKTNYSISEFLREIVTEYSNGASANKVTFDSSKIEEDIKKMGVQIQNLLNVFSEDVDKNFEEQKNVIKNLGSQLNNFAQTIAKQTPKQ